MDIEEPIVAIFLAIFVISVLSVIGYEYSGCIKDGGDYVRGVIWFNCIKG